MQQLVATPAQIPDDIARLAHEQKLGTPQGNYAIFKLTRNWRWRYFILLSLLCTEIMFIAITAILLILLPHDFSPDNAFSMLNFWIPLCQGVFLLMAFFTISNKEYTLYSCKEGFILKESKKKFRTIRWTEIERVWHTVAHVPKSAFKVHRVYRIQCHDGYTLTFSGSVPALSGLDDCINEYFTQRRLPAYLADYKAGRTLNFGPLTISLAGIGKNDKMLSWAQITDISLYKNCRLLVSKIGNQGPPWLDIAALKIPNLSIFLALSGQIRGTQTVHKEIVQPLPLELKAAKEPGAAAIKLRHQIIELPEELALLASEHRLGERRTDGRFGISTIVIWPMIAAQAIVLLIIAVFMLVMLNSMASSAYGWEQNFNSILRIGFVLIFITIVLIIFTPVVQHINQYTYTFEQGMILKRGRKAPIICRWDEIEVAWRASFIGKRPVHLPGLYSGYTIQQHDGSRFALSELDVSLKAFSTILREQVTPLQLPALLSVYQSGQTLPFGPLHVSQEGITMGARLLPWGQVKSVSLEENQLAIYGIIQRQPWSKLAAARVPNLFMLFALADYVREGAISPDDQYTGV